MKLEVKFEELEQRLDLDFGEFVTASNGGYEDGYADGYAKGEADGDAEGYGRGYTEGLAARTYEVWTITLADGSVVEKEVALL